MPVARPRRLRPDLRTPKVGAAVAQEDDAVELRHVEAGLRELVGLCQPAVEIAPAAGEEARDGLGEGALILGLARRDVALEEHVVLRRPRDDVDDVALLQVVAYREEGLPLAG